MNVEDLSRRLAELRANDGFLTPAEAELLLVEGYDTALAPAAAALLKPDDFRSAEDRSEALRLLSIDNQIPDTDREAFIVKVMQWLGRRLTQLGQRERSIEVLDLGLGRFVGLELALTGRLVAEDDPLVARDEERRTYTEAHAGAQWVLVGGGIVLKAETQVPVEGITIGFAARSTLGYTLLQPVRDLGDVADVVKRTTVELPLSAENALALPRGAEMLLSGVGSVTLSAGTELSSVLDAVPYTFALGGSVRILAGVRLTLRVKRLEANRATASIAVLVHGDREASFGLRAGSTYEVAEALGSLGGGIVGRGADLLEGPLQKQIDRWSRIDLRTTTRVTEIESELQSYVFDLSDPAARAAFEDLLGLDLRAAHTSALSTSGSVAHATLRERIQSAQDKLSFQLSALNILGAISEASRRQGQLETHTGSKITYARTRLQDELSGVFARLGSGEREVARELVQYRIDESPEQMYYRISYTAKAGWDPDDDIRGLIGLCQVLGLVEDAHAWLESRERAVDRLRNAARTVDVYVSHFGLDKVMETTRDHLERAFGQAYETIQTAVDGIRRPISPWLDDEHPRHADVLSLLRDRNARGMQVAEYRRLSGGRELTRDRYVRSEGIHLAKLFGELQSAATPEQRADTIYSASRALKLPFYRELGMLALAAGREHLILNRIELRDDDQHIHLVLADEDAPQDIDHRIQQILSRPDQA